MVKDPVCGMTIEEGAAAGAATFEGQTYHFCSDACKAKFLQNPRQYADSGHQGYR